MKFPKIDFDAAKEALFEVLEEKDAKKLVENPGFKERPSAREKKVQAALLFLEKIVQPQLKEKAKEGKLSKGLDLSNSLAERFGFSASRAKTTRAFLVEAEIIFFPSFSKPKKKGDYPLYFMDLELCSWVEIGKRRRSKPKNFSFIPIYYSYSRAALSIAATYNASLKTPLGDNKFFPLVQVILAYLLATDHLPKDELRKENAASLLVDSSFAYAANEWASSSVAEAEGIVSDAFQMRAAASKAGS